MLKKSDSTGATGTCDCSDLEARIAALESQVATLIIDTTPDLLSTVYSQTPALQGIGTSIIKTGATYNFWDTGTLTNPVSLNNKQTYYIATSDQIPALKDFKGTPTVTTMWIQEPDGTLYTQPINIDTTGIYFTPSSSINGLPSGTTFKFTQPLILSDIA
ncbi:MAG: hypothetical protein LBM87_07415 [Ruminococcus sp.]|jgi:hypothetical protein|nr:hypothetical protein [Ruminococcus sp.]